MKREKRINNFKTADLALAAALSVVGFPVEEMEQMDARRFVFIFSDNPELQKEIKKYWLGELKVVPQTYFNQLKVLKARIYER